MGPHLCLSSSLCHVFILFCADGRSLVDLHPGRQAVEGIQIENRNCYSRGSDRRGNWNCATLSRESGCGRCKCLPFSPTWLFGKRDENASAIHAGTSPRDHFRNRGPEARPVGGCGAWLGGAAGWILSL